MALHPYYAEQHPDRELDTKYIPVFRHLAEKARVRLTRVIEDSLQPYIYKNELIPEIDALADSVEYSDHFRWSEIERDLHRLDVGDISEEFCYQELRKYEALLMRVTVDPQEIQPGEGMDFMQQLRQSQQLNELFEEDPAVELRKYYFSRFALMMDEAFSLALGFQDAMKNGQADEYLNAAFERNAQKTAEDLISLRKELEIDSNATPGQRVERFKTARDERGKRFANELLDRYENIPDRQDYKLANFLEEVIGREDKVGSSRWAFHKKMQTLYDLTLQEGETPSTSLAGKHAQEIWEENLLKACAHERGIKHYSIAI